MSLIGAILIVIIMFIFFKKLNEKIEDKIERDINNYFEKLGYQLVEIERIKGEKVKDLPFEIMKWKPSTDIEGRNYFANRFWKITLKNKDNKKSIKWVNTGHLFLYKMYFIVK